MNVPKIGSNFEIDGYNTVKCTGDPNKDAKNFAEANNISVSDAKKILSGKFGDPVKKQAEDVAKAAATATDDDVELDDDADFEVDKTGEVTDFFEIDDTDEADDADDADEADDEVINDAVKAELNDSIDDISDKWQEVANTYNAWQKAGGGWANNGTPLWKYHSAAKDFQASISDFLDYVDTLDLSTLDNATKSAIEDAKDSARKWSDRFEKSLKTQWWSDSTLWSKASTSSKKTRTFTQNLITQLKSAGLATSDVVKPSKPN